ncbi:hypothetical protein PCANC_28067 [Puccinia coronata f. sp. avenae]|uniref:Uncharacterized protein n=1 Tax=Puccinia coronata f. sp. avenae TaxID=200324 RepID=A0A2N5TJN7_9BASI|nr:hypothetical protein PCANC_28067 [Puccinia coronata f. sp. avenae]
MPAPREFSPAANATLQIAPEHIPALHPKPEIKNAWMVLNLLPYLRSLRCQLIVPLRLGHALDRLCSTTSAKTHTKPITSLLTMAAPHATAPVGNMNVNLAETTATAFRTLVAWAKSLHIPVPFRKPRPKTQAPAPFAEAFACLK